ncbi:MAG: helix-turn-helix transcriptional regulator [Thermoanaerobaculia bacterium]
MLRSELGRRIIRTRIRRGWTQAELARRLGVPRERLGKWERGLNAPSLEDLAALSEVLEVPLEGLGLGCGARRTISNEELTELVFHLGAVARLVKPWRERRDKKEE